MEKTQKPKMPSREGLKNFTKSLERIEKREPSDELLNIVEESSEKGAELITPQETDLDKAARPNTPSN